MTTRSDDLVRLDDQGLAARWRARAQEAAVRLRHVRFADCGSCATLRDATECAFAGQEGAELCAQAGVPAPACRYADEARRRIVLEERVEARALALRASGAEVAPVRVVLAAEEFPLPDAAPEAQRERLRAAGALARWFLEHPREGRFLVLGGPTGSGKSVCAAWIVAGACSSSVWLRADVLTSFKAWDAVADRVEGAGLLVVDDLGAEPNWARDLLGRVLRTRADDDRRTIVTTNLPSADLGKSYGDRLMSRLEGHRTRSRAAGGDVWMHLTRGVPGALDLRTGREPA